MSTATLRQTTGSVLAVVNESTSAIASIFTAVGGGASMLNRYVTDAKAKQALSSVVTMSDYQTQLIEDKSLENAERSLAIYEKLDSNPKLEAQFNEHKARIEALFAPKAN